MDNDIERPNYNYWNIFRIVETANPALKTAIFSTWTDNRTKLIGEKLPSAGNIKLDYAFDGFENDTITFPRDKERLFIFKIDEKVSTEAGRYIRTEGPDLSWVYLEYTDDMGHQYGDSPQMKDAIKKADVQVGRIWEAIKEREKQFNEEWMIVVTTDHGRDELTGKDHGGQSERERTIWMLTNVKNTNHRFRDMPATVDILPSILRFMKVDGPESVMMELDGVPFIGPVSVANMNAMRQNDKIEITWDVLDPSGQVTIQLATTNNFKEGKPDSYKTVAEMATSAGRCTIDVSKMKSSFYKVLLRAPFNMTNRWIVSK
jgi:predicted AlkP superfamily pyrophosphatase or phosphodiesterase